MLEKSFEKMGKGYAQALFKQLRQGDSEEIKLPNAALPASPRSCRARPASVL
jgi:hypothetical protein